MFPPDSLLPSPPLDPPPSLVSSSSSALPPPLALCKSLALLRPSQSPARHGVMDSLASPHLHLSLSARRLHRDPSALGLLLIPSSIWLSLCQSSLCLRHGLPGLQLRLDPLPLGSTWVLLPSGFPVILTPSIITLVPCISGFTLGFQAMDVALVHRPISSAGSPSLPALPPSVGSQIPPRPYAKDPPWLLLPSLSFTSSTLLGLV